MVKVPQGATALSGVAGPARAWGSVFPRRARANLPLAKMTRFGILVCVMALLLGGARIASAGPFEVREVDWEGCSGLFELARSELGEGRVVALSNLDWSELKPEDAILLIHPDHAISSEKLAAFLGAGGRLAVLDDERR